MIPVVFDKPIQPCNYRPEPFRNPNTTPKPKHLYGKFPVVEGRANGRIGLNLIVKVVCPYCGDTHGHAIDRRIKKPQFRQAKCETPAGRIYDDNEPYFISRKPVPENTWIEIPLDEQCREADLFLSLLKVRV